MDTILEPLLFSYQNFTQDNKTQGIMEKSQWDLKKIRLKGRRLTRLDDFMKTYKDTHTANTEFEMSYSLTTEWRFKDSVYVFSYEFIKTIG